MKRLLSSSDVREKPVERLYYSSSDCCPVFEEDAVILYSINTLPPTEVPCTVCAISIFLWCGFHKVSWYHFLCFPLFVFTFILIKPGGCKRESFCKPRQMSGLFYYIYPVLGVLALCNTGCCIFCVFSASIFRSST